MKLPSSITKFFMGFWTLENLIFLSLSVLCFLIAFLFTKYSKSRSATFDEKIKSMLLKKIVAQKRLVFLVYSALMWLTYWIFIYFKYNPEMIRIIASLSTAWFVIEYTTNVAKKSLMSKSFAVFIWFLTALYIFKLLNPFIAYSKKLSLNVGALEISLYTVISAYVIFAILFWGLTKLEALLETAFHRSRLLTASQKVLYTKVTKFALLAFAVLIGFRMVGIDVTSITILSGAIGFGIGFGLQKVFSNLISGIILLVDKSIKPGDVIAVGDAYGVVSNLEARYVSIVTRDGKKHLIPNESLVTERVENWSFRDDRIRLSIKIGVSYDENPEKVREVLLECVRDHPRVLSDPEPICLLVDFGDSSMDFELRFWISDPINGVGRPKSEIRFRIWEAFQKNHISIPYPHQEVILKRDPHEKESNPNPH